MQRGKWCGCRGGRGEKLSEGPASAVEALEQWALSSVGGSQVGGEGGAPLLQSGSGTLELRFTQWRGRLWAALGAGTCAGTLLVGAAVEVRSQGSPPVDAQGDGCRA